MMHMRLKRISTTARTGHEGLIPLGFMDVPADDPQIRPMYRLIEQQYPDREVWHLYHCGDTGFQDAVLRSAQRVRTDGL